MRLFSLGTLSMLTLALLFTFGCGKNANTGDNSDSTIRSFVINSGEINSFTGKVVALNYTSDQACYNPRSGFSTGYYMDVLGKASNGVESQFKFVLCSDTVYTGLTRAAVAVGVTLTVTADSAGGFKPQYAYQAINVTGSRPVINVAIPLQYCRVVNNVTSFLLDCGQPFNNFCAAKKLGKAKSVTINYGPYQGETQVLVGTNHTQLVGLDFLYYANSLSMNCDSY